MKNRRVAKGISPVLLIFAFCSIEANAVVLKNKPPVIKSKSAVDITIKNSIVSKIKPKVLLYPSGIIETKRKKQITLGFIAPLSGGIKNLGIELAHGIEQVFNDVNRKGGINGYRIKFLVRDDAYRLKKGKDSLKSILKKTTMLFGTFGSDLLSIIPKDFFDELLVLFPVAGASLFRSPDYDSLFFYRASIANEMEAIVNYAVKQLGRRRIAIFYEDDIWGESGFEAAKEYLTKLNCELIASASYSRNTVNVLPAVEKIASNLPDAIICISHSLPIYNFIRQTLNRGLQNCAFLGTCETSIIQEHLRKSRGVELVTSSVVPSPWKSQIQIAKEYRKAMKLISRELSPISFEGFVMASLFVDVLKNITPPITKQKICNYIEQMRKFNFKGLNLNFDSMTRSLFENVWFNVGANKKWSLFDQNHKNGSLL